MIEEKTDCTRMLASEKSDSSSTLAQREGETWSLPSRSQIRSCMAHASNAGCSNIDCRDLHICRVYLRGSACKFGKTCRFGHDLSTSHNELCLRRHGVPGADINAVRRLWSACRGAEELPWICTFYNSAAGCRYGEEGGGCTKLHVCAYYVKGNCAYEGKCSRSHNVLDRQPKAILQKHGIDTNRQSRDILREFREAFRDREDFCQQMTSAEYDDDGGDVDEEDDSDDIQSEEGATSRASGIATGRRPPRKPSPPFGPPDERRRDEGDQRDDRPPEICVFGLGKGVCLYRTKCRNLHAGQPFLWQYVVPGRRATDEWASFDDECNRELEFNYADPNNDKCLSTLVRYPCLSPFRVDFDKMMVYWPGEHIPSKVRLLTTRSSVMTSSPCEHYTKWRWFRLDNRNSWVEYGEAYPDAEVDSDVLERESLTNADGTFSFEAGRHSYTIDFRKMVERCDSLDEERPIRRRPVLPKITAENVYDIVPTILLTPSYWDLFIPGCGRVYDTVKISQSGETADEYRKVEDRFKETMPTAEWQIESIERVQNLELWRNYLRKRHSIQTRLGCDSVSERLLFHGGKEEHLSAICSQGLDVVIDVGFGTGIPFVRDASRSTPFRNDKLLLLRVLIGEHASSVGGSTGRRDDVCVTDDASRPSAFVVFEKEQSYPEYIITYGANAKSANAARRKSRPTGREKSRGSTGRSVSCVTDDANRPLTFDLDPEREHSCPDHAVKTSCSAKQTTSRRRRSRSRRNKSAVRK